VCLTLSQLLVGAVVVLILVILHLHLVGQVVVHLLREQQVLAHQDRDMQEEQQTRLLLRAEAGEVLAGLEQILLEVLQV
jgi:hypothetical protein